LSAFSTSSYIFVTWKGGYGWVQFWKVEIIRNGLTAGNIIGRGGASQVYKGQTKDGKLVAVKCLNQGGHQAEEEILTDIQITCSLSHVNIVKLLGYCTDAPHMILVYDYVAQGSLDDHLHGKIVAKLNT
jgi:serine/threonine protein kinase